MLFLFVSYRAGQDLQHNVELTNAHPCLAPDCKVTVPGMSPWSVTFAICVLINRLDPQIFITHSTHTHPLLILWPVPIYLSTHIIWNRYCLQILLVLTACDIFCSAVFCLSSSSCSILINSVLFIWCAKLINLISRCFLSPKDDFTILKCMATLGWKAAVALL